MIILKSIIFIVISTIIVTIFVKNFKNWTTRHRSYMIENSKKTLGTGMVWEKPFGKVIVKIIYVVWIILAILFAYILIFS